MTEEELRLVLSVVGTDKAVEAQRRLEELGVKAEQAAVAADKVHKSTVNVGQSMLQTGRIVQDFVQGGIGGILNNVEGFTAALGLGSGLAGLATAVGVAFYLAAPKVKSFFDSVVNGANEVPKTRDHIKGLTDDLAAMRKELDQLAEKHVLTNRELARFEELTVKAAAAQKELNRLQKEQAEIERLKALKSEEQREHGEAVSTVIGPDVEKVIGEASKGAIAQSAQGGKLAQLHAQAAIWQKMAISQQDMPGGAAARQQVARYQALIEEERARLRGEAQTAVTEATQGNVGALNRVIGMLPAGRTREGLEGLTPRAMEQQQAELDAAEQTARKLHDAGVRRREAAAARAKEDAQDAKEHEEALRDFDREQQHEAARKAHESQNLARQLGRADAAAHAARDPNKGIEQIPLLKEGATPMEIRQQLLENQARLAANAARDREFLIQARRLGRQIQDDGQSALQR
jgi:hypothetical protein